MLMANSDRKEEKKRRFLGKKYFNTKKHSKRTGAIL